MKKSLQAIKTTIAKKEEALKALQKIHPHLTHLSEAQILTYFSVETIPELEQHIKESTQPYSNMALPDSQLCSCTDSKGQPKDLYAVKEFAQKEVNTLEIQQRVKLKVYLCPYGCGWHLSKL